MRKKMHVGYLKRTARPGQYTFIPNLSAAFCIKRCPVKDHQAFPTFIYCFNFSIIRHERQNRRGAVKAVVAGEICSFLNTDPGDPFHTELTGGTSPIPLAGHRLFKAFHVDTQTALAGIVGGEIGGKAESIVEPEGKLAWNHCS